MQNKTLLEKIDWKILKNFNVISLLSDAELQDLFKEIIIRNIPKEEIVCVENTYNKSMFLIYSGRVQTSKNSVVLSEIEENHFFALMALMQKIKRSTTIKTLVDSVIIEIPEETFTKYICNSKCCLKKICSFLNKRLTGHDTKLVTEYQKLQKSYQNLKILNEAYHRFVPAEFLELLEKENVININLNDYVQKNMTILFSDIRGFTSLSEGMSPEDNFNFINNYLKRISPIIRNNSGVVDKYIGDSIMALFSGPVEDAISSAIAMLNEINILNNERADLGHSPIVIGIGIHVGNLILGTVGEESRMDVTAISDNVNLASRLETLTKHFGITIAISEQVLDKIKTHSKFHYRLISTVRVIGKKVPVTIYEILDGLPKKIMDLKMKTIPYMKKGIDLLKNKNLLEAKSVFEESLLLCPNDKAVLRYISIIDKHIKYGISDNWEWIEQLDEK